MTRKRVETGRRRDNRVEILSGLEKTEQVVVSGGAFLADGSAVRVVNDAEAAGSEAAK